jgi:DNA-directed RNA polymerase subunit RPC12/RpoP
MIQFKCSECKNTNHAPEEKAGTAAFCSECGAKLIVPSPRREIDDDDDEILKVVVEKDDRPVEEPQPMPSPKPKKKKRKQQSEDDDVDLPSKPISDVEGENVLGPRKRVFTPVLGTFRIAAIVCSIVALAGMLSCLLSLVVNMPSGTSLFIIFSIPVGLAGLLWCMNFLTMKVSVHASGIVHSHRGKSRIIPWEDISKVTESIGDSEQSGSHASAEHVYTLELSDRTEFVYSNKRIERVDELGDIIIDKTSALILPQVRVQYDRGKVFDFGRLGVSREGLHYRKNILPWKEIKGVKIADGYIEVSKQGNWEKWCNIKTSSVPNLHVFIMFVNEVVGSDRERRGL